MKKLLLSLILPMTLYAMEPMPKKRSLQQTAQTAPNIILSKPYQSDQPNIININACMNQNVVGRIQFIKTGTIGKICLMKVMESYRKLGIGFQLFKAAILELQQMGCDTIIWDAITPATGNIEELKSIYTHMVAKLKEDLECDFICGEIKKNNDFHTILMKLLLKKINKKIQIDTIKK